MKLLPNEELKKMMKWLPDEELKEFRFPSLFLANSAGKCWPLPE